VLRTLEAIYDLYYGVVVSVPNDPASSNGNAADLYADQPMYLWKKKPKDEIFNAITVLFE